MVSPPQSIGKHLAITYGEKTSLLMFQFSGLLCRQLQEAAMPEIFIKTNPKHSPSRDEATFYVLLWALERVGNQDARRLLIEAMAMLAIDE